MSYIQLLINLLALNVIIIDMFHHHRLLSTNFFASIYLLFTLFSTQPTYVMEKLFNVNYEVVV